jgi:predicted dehydrogenase/threonine dehydrogenase-like Zn-dependent dehydrogenase
MRQILRTVQGMKVHDVSMPTPGDNEILIEVHASVISTGTETMGMQRGDSSLSEKLLEKKALLDKVRKSLSENGLKTTVEAIRRKLNPQEQALIFQPVGYSNAGVVIRKGRLVSAFNVGDRVACAGSGIAAHAEYAVIPVNLAVKLPEGVDFISGGFTTIGAIAMQGIRRANVTFGETIIITGLGLLGLLAVQIAKAWGLTVIGTDLMESRLDLAERVGADLCLKADDKDFLKKVAVFTGGMGADAVIIYAATKSSFPSNQGLAACRKKGRVVVVGAVGMELERQEMYAKELDFVMSTSYGPGRYDDQYEIKGIDYPVGYVRWTENRNMMAFVSLMARKLVNTEYLISKVYAIDQVDEAYKNLLDNPEKNIASVFTYDHQEGIEEKKLAEGKISVQKPRIGVGIIGAGSFIKATHLENLLNCRNDFELIAIANRTPASAKSVQEKYKPRYVSTDYMQLLHDPDIDLVIIGTRHNLHAEQVVNSIAAGKHVLVEKPLALMQHELKEISEATAAHPGIVVTVGFNRRYSPFVQRAKKIISEKQLPVVINYRINAGYLPPDLWIQKPDEGGGRIAGEVCHFIDLAGYLAGSKVKTIGAVHIPLSPEIKSEDNVIVTLSFENGSVGVITYASLGGKEMEKERIEIFYDNSSLVINDFTEFRTYNCKESGFKLRSFDKGHKSLIEELAKKIKGEPSLILPVEDDIESTRLTLEVIDIIHQSF